MTSRQKEITRTLQEGGYIWHRYHRATEAFVTDIEGNTQRLQMRTIDALLAAGVLCEYDFSQSDVKYKYPRPLDPMKSRINTTTEDLEKVWGSNPQTWALEDLAELSAMEPLMLELDGPDAKYTLKRYDAISGVWYQATSERFDADEIEGL